jgi:hypothetical protein
MFILFILLFVTLCVKIDLGTHKGIHSVLILKLGVTTSEPTMAGRQVLEPFDTWQQQSPPRLGGRVRCCSTRGVMWVHVLILVLT